MSQPKSEARNFFLHVPPTLLVVRARENPSICGLGPLFRVLLLIEGERRFEVKEKRVPVFSPLF